MFINGSDHDSKIGVLNVEAARVSRKCGGEIPITKLEIRNKFQGAKLKLSALLAVPPLPFKGRGDRRAPSASLRFG
jgi:hypothetical protein